MFAQFLSIFLVIVSLFTNFAFVIGGSVKPDFESPEVEVEKPTYGDSVSDSGVPAFDYNGYEFVFLTQFNMNKNSYSNDYLVAEEESHNILDQAIFKRNEIVSEKHNVVVKQLYVSDLLTTVRTQVMGGATEFDMILGSAGKLAVLARENLLCDLNRIDRFDMTKEYWDSNAAEQLKIGDKLYFTNCDMNIQEIAYVVYFNKQLINDYNLTSPYEYMKNNEWTIDNWAKLVKSVSKDLNGDGSLEEFDQYGTLYEFNNLSMFLYGAGVRATTNNADNIPELTFFDTDKAVTVYEKCKDVFSSSSSWCINEMSNSDTHGYNDKWDYARSLFSQDLYLFHYEGTNIIHQFADMESEFGIVPFPKYNSQQEGYYSLYPFACNLVALPNVFEDLDRTANVVEDLNYYSSEVLKSVWFDTLLSRRYTRDDESEACLDITLEGRVYDLGVYYDFGQIRTAILDADVRSGNMSREFARRKAMIEADMKVVIRDFGLAN